MTDKTGSAPEPQAVEDSQFPDDGWPGNTDKPSQVCPSCHEHRGGSLYLHGGPCPHPFHTIPSAHSEVEGLTDEETAWCADIFGELTRPNVLHFATIVDLLTEARAALRSISVQRSGKL